MKLELSKKIDCYGNTYWYVSKDGAAKGCIMSSTVDSPEKNEQALLEFNKWVELQKKPVETNEVIIKTEII